MPTDTWQGQAAVKVDPAGREGIFLAFVGRVFDAEQRPAMERLYCFFHDAHTGAVSQVEPKSVWDWRDPSRQVEPPPSLTEMLDEAAAQAEAETSRQTQGLLDEAKQARERDAEIKRRYADEYYRWQIDQATQRLAEYSSRAMQGEDVRLASQNEERRLRELEVDWDDVKARLVRETLLSVDAPQLIAAALVLAEPAAAQADRRRIEQAGMAVAMKFETEQGRTPADVSLEFRGYDIYSQATDEVRYIEVKAFAETGAVQMTENEWFMAQKLGERYWLYVVENALTEMPSLHLISDPARKLRAQEVVTEVFMRIANWKEAAERGSGYE